MMRKGKSGDKTTLTTWSPLRRDHTWVQREARKETRRRNEGASQCLVPALHFSNFGKSSLHDSYKFHTMA